MSFFELHPFLEIPQVIALVTVAVALSVWLHLKETRRGFAGYPLLLIRTACIASIGLLLLNPVRVQSTESRPEKSQILVLIDTSHSMSVKDMDGKERIEAVRKAVFSPEMTAALSSGSDTTYFAFSNGAHVQSAAALAKPGLASGSQTFIADSLAQALSTVGGGKKGAVLVASDGRDNGDISPVEVARQAKDRGFPVFTLCVGKETMTKDLSIVMNRAQVFSAPNQEVSLLADVASSGYDGMSATVRLFREGVKIQEKVVELEPGGHREVEFSAREKAKATYRYSVEVAPAPGEVTTSNNRASCLLSVGNATTQVLVVEGKPSWDAKFLIQTLRSDPSVSVDSVFQLSGDRSFAIQGVASEDGASDKPLKLPKTRAEFAKYDVVIIGKGFEEFFDDRAAKDLEKYVSDDGGHLIFMRGQADKGSSTISEMEPVAWDNEDVHDFRMKVTREGTSNPAFSFGRTSDPDTIVQKLPTLISATRVAREKSLSVVLARASGVTSGQQPDREMAVLAYQRYGDGLVMSLVGQGLWRWALLPPDLDSYSKCFNDFWTQLVHWMANQSDFLPGQNIALRTNHSIYSPGEQVDLMAFVRGKETTLPPAKITDPNGHTLSVSLGKADAKQVSYVGSFHAKIPGDYVATIAEPGPKGGRVTAPFSVYEHRQEDLNTSADPGLMRQIADVSGGKALDINEIQQLPSLINKASASRIQKPEPQSIWDRWEVLAFLTGLLGTEWFWRRRRALV